MDADQLTLLRDFVQLCKSSPEVLHKPELAFLKEWIER